MAADRTHHAGLFQCSHNGVGIGIIVGREVPSRGMQADMLQGHDATVVSGARCADALKVCPLGFFVVLAHIQPDNGQVIVVQFFRDLYQDPAFIGLHINGLSRLKHPSLDHIARYAV